MVSQIWLLIAVIFFYFSYRFWHYSNQPLRSFTIRERFGSYQAQPEETEGDIAIKQFLHEFEGYLASVNTTNKARYRLGTLGFLVAGFAALVAAIIPIG
ncbi:MAG: hypothetical protein GTO18_08540 [Anaerolineales bacterium]|nr:hypothetical protein [Anaerolineales bacterium]